MTAASTLDTIVARVRADLEDRRARGVVADVAPAETGPRRGFRKALAQAGGINVVAEFKRRSPSRGAIREDLAPEDVARRYERSGAAALSVLTEPHFFGGSLADLKAARAAVSLPVLRKDFIVDRAQVDETVAAGADAILLIVAALDGSTLETLHRAATDRGLDVLVEVHDAGELDRALSCGATLVGVNNRDLKTMEVRLETCLDLRARIPASCVAVAESGIKTASDVERLAAAGYHAILVGESLMSAPEPGEALRDLLAGVGARRR